MDSWLFIIWANLAALRFMLCMLPQPGYIYPDEFFQSPEIMAGDVLGLMSHRTWEWNNTTPVRTIVFPVLSSWLPFRALKLFPTEFLTPYAVVLLPRIWMAILSFLGDHLIYRIAKKLYGRSSVYADVATILYASSYVTWVYCTRTFSNVFEMILLAYLLDLVLREKKEGLLDDFVTKPVFIGVTVMGGFFIRISFPCFAFVPVTFWLFKKYDTNRIILSLGNVMLRGLGLLQWLVITFFIIAMWDTMYFKPELFDKYASLNQSKVNSFYEILKSGEENKKVPYTLFYNMIYNFRRSNLEKHGLHPWYLHTLVNLPMLFGPIVLVYFYNILFKKFSNHVEYTSKFAFYVLNLTFFCALCSLSLVPHQEPRFILPLIVPLSIICAKSVYPLKKILTSSWIFWNILGFVFFGILHQGGMLPCMEYLNTLAKTQTELRNSAPDKGNDMLVIFYRTYMPPEHLTALKVHVKDKEIPLPPPKLSIIDFAGVPLSKLELGLDIGLTMHKDNHVDIYLVFPGSLSRAEQLELEERYDMKLYYRFYPHLSTEDLPPDLWNNLDQLTLNIYHVRSLKVQAELPLLNAHQHDEPIQKVILPHGYAQKE